MKVDNDKVVRVCVDQINSKAGLEGKRILDLGCGKGNMVRYIAQYFDPAFVQGVDLSCKEESGFNYSIKKDDARKLDLDDNSYDVVYSIGTFEHINGLQDTLKEIKRILKPKGRAIILTSPIWTSVCGHHSYCWWPSFTEKAKRECQDRDEDIVYSIPPWAHLWMDEKELSNELSKNNMSKERIEATIDYIYKSKYLNRVPLSEMKKNFNQCGMIIREYREEVSFSREWAFDKKGPSEMTDKIQQKLLEHGYNIYDVGVTGLTVVLEKYEAII